MRRKKFAGNEIEERRTRTQALPLTVRAIGGMGSRVRVGMSRKNLAGSGNYIGQRTKCSVGQVEALVIHGFIWVELDPHDIGGGSQGMGVSATSESTSGRQDSRVVSLSVSNFNIVVSTLWKVSKKSKKYAIIHVYMNSQENLKKYLTWEEKSTLK